MKAIKKALSTSAFRLILIVVIVVLPINILTLVLSTTTIEEVEQQMSMELQSVLDLYMAQIDGAIKTITTKMHSLAIDDANFARLNVKEIVDKGEYYNQMQSAVNLKNTLGNVLNDNTWVTGIFTTFPEKEMQVLKSKYTSYNRSLLDYVNKVIASNDKDKLRKWQLVNIQDNYILLFLANHKNSYYGAWFDLRRLADILELDKETFDYSVFAFADDEKKNFYAINKEEQLENINGHGKKDKDFVKVSSASEYSNLILMQFLSKTEMIHSLPRMIYVLKGFSVLALFILPIIILSLKKWMLNPLNQLTYAMEQIEKGDMNYRISALNTGSEFEHINQSFNHMMDEVSKLKIDIYEQKLEKQKIKMRFLSQQIKPHFILNAMNILYSYEQDEYPLIQKMILCISKYFRYIVNANSPYVELKYEMEHIKNYFEIQEARYPKTFFAMVEYEDDLGTCLLPPLIIQNFAENAIKHSLKIGNQIEIFVTAKVFKENFVKIILKDTGEGISQDIIEQIKTFRKTRKDQEGLGVGIQNSIERLAALYGKKASLEVFRQEPKGTRIEIILPLYIEREDQYV